MSQALPVQTSRRSALLDDFACTAKLAAGMTSASGGARGLEIPVAPDATFEQSRIFSPEMRRAFREFRG